MRSLLIRLIARLVTTLGYDGRRYSPNYDFACKPMKKLLLLWLAIAFWSAFNPVLFGPSVAAKAEDDFTIVQVADGVYSAIAKPGGLASGNAGFIIGDDGVVIFDTFFTPTAIEELIGEIQKLTNKPIKYAVNSHYH